MGTIKHSFFTKEGKWLRGNLHTHTTRSDGICPPDRQIQDYIDEGYDFLSITDHNIMDSFKAKADGEFCLLPGWERDINYSTTKCIHLVGISAKDAESQEIKESKRCIPGELTDQELLNSMLSLNEFVILAHPLWSRMEPDEVLNLEGFNAIEVYNTICERKCHTGHAEVYWDMLLRNGRRVLGIASDDTHGKTRKSDRFGGWVMVKAVSCTHHDIMASLRTGNYYSTMGPEIYDWGMDGSKIYVKCSPCNEIHFITYPPRGETLYKEECYLNGAFHQSNGDESYIRIECIDDKGKVAWTNPTFLENSTL